MNKLSKHFMNATDEQVAKLVKFLNNELPFNASMFEGCQDPVLISKLEQRKYASSLMLETIDKALRARINTLYSGNDEASPRKSNYENDVMTLVSRVYGYQAIKNIPKLQGTKFMEIKLEHAFQALRWVVTSPEFDPKTIVKDFNIKIVLDKASQRYNVFVGDDNVL